MKKDISRLPVMPKCCKSCPFKLNKNGIWQNVELASAVTERTLFKAVQICHSTEGKNREPRFKCRGSFDHNKTIYNRMGIDSKLVPLNIRPLLEEYE